MENFLFTSSAKFWPKLNGIYCIVNTENQKKYVGLTRHRQGFYRRWTEHRSFLRSGEHPNRFLQRAYNISSETSFKLEILQVCDPSEDLEFFEGLWQDRLETLNSQNGYNLVRYDPLLDKIDYTNRKTYTIDYEFINPEGIIVRGNNLLKFAKTHNMESGHLGQVLLGKLSSYKGFKSTNPDFHRKKKIHKLLSPNNELFVTDDIRKFCVEYDLNLRQIRDLIYLKRKKSITGWSLYVD